MTSAQSTIESLLGEVQRLRLKVRGLESNRSRESNRSHSPAHSSLSAAPHSFHQLHHLREGDDSFDDGGSDDREVLMRRNKILQASVRKLELQLAKRTQLCDNLTKELVEATEQRSRDVEFITSLGETQKSLTEALAKANSAAVATQKKSEEATAAAEEEVERVKCMTRETIESLSDALKRSLERQAVLESMLPTTAL